MDTTTVTLDVIDSPEAKAYFTGADRRVMIGLRVALEMLGIPLPQYALRKQTGPRPAKSALAAFYADYPMPRTTVLPERRPNALPDRIAQMQVHRAARLG